MCAQRKRLRVGERLEDRLCLSAVAFVRTKVVFDIESPVYSLSAADVDGDSDLDLIYQGSGPPGPSSQWWWHPNLDGEGLYGERQLISCANSMTAADHPFDADKPGIIAATSFTFCPTPSIGIIHFEFDGDEWLDTLLVDSLYHPTTAEIADLDGDGDSDVLVGDDYGRVLQWYENIDGTTLNVDSPTILATRDLRHVATIAADIDGDADFDLLSWDSSELLWYENIGKGRFSDAQTIASGRRGQPHLGDFDGDNDLDIVTCDSRTERVTWFENLGADGFAETFQLRLECTDGTVRDVDADDDQDVLISTDNELLWFNNIDSKGEFEQKVISTHTAGIVFASADIDSDGDSDIVLSNGELYESRLIGDVNDDGVFNSSDLVAVFQADKYEDAIPNNATFDEGDWNQDGDFDSADIVFAFQAGDYVAAASPLKAQLAGAVDRLFAEQDGAEPLRVFR